MRKHAKLKEKQKWFNEKLHLENARKLRGIYFIDPEEKEFKETIKNARKKLETSVAPAMPCKIMKNCGSGASNKIKTRLACILEAESKRLRMGESLPNHHEDHVNTLPRIQSKHMWKMATRNEWDELQNHNKANQDKKFKDTDANDDGDDNATAHFTDCEALHNWARARSPDPCTFFITLTSWLKLCLAPFTPIFMAIHVSVLSSCWSSPLSTSSPSSFPSSFPSSSTSTTSCNRSSTRRTWKTCATPRQMMVRTLTTSSTPPQTYCRKRKQFITALQFGSQIYSYASSHKISSRKSSGGQEMGKVEKIFGVEFDESQK